MAISVTARIRDAMLGLTVGLCVLFAALIFLLVYVIEDQIFVNQLKLEQASYEQTIKAADPPAIQAWQPTNAYIQRIDHSDGLPQALPNENLQTILASTGVHEFFDDNEALFIAHFSRPDTGASYFLRYDVQDLLAVRGSKLALFVLIGGLTLLIMLIAMVLAGRLTKSTLAPVSRLSDALKENDLDHVVIELAQEFSQDEIGVLAGELAQALENVQAAAQREYEFNRGVSHELRSPIQVAQSASELLELYAGEQATQLHKPISRLQRAVSEMNEIAEAFLWLANDRELSEDEMCRAEEARGFVAALQTTYPDREISCSLEAEVDCHYPIPATVLAVVLRNLVRNAVIHGDGQGIGVEMTPRSILVSNPLGAASQANLGFGIGLSIVQRICDRFGCELVSGQGKDEEFSVLLRFPG